jgi:hypothetical protein
MRFTKSTIAAAVLMASGLAQASVVVLDFEGINATYPSGFAFVQDFYNNGTSSDGTSGTDYGISFTSNAQAICLNTPGTTCSNTSRGGLGDPTSQLGGLFFLSGAETYMNVTGGFDTGFSFFYSAPFNTGSVSVYDGFNGTGNVLATFALPLTSSTCTGVGQFCPFEAAGVSFSGTALSVAFAGVANQIVFDDVTFGSSNPGDPGNQVPEPASLALVSIALLGAGVASSRRRRRAAQA